MTRKSFSTFLAVLLISECFSEFHEVGSDWMLKRISRRQAIEGVDWALDRLNELKLHPDGTDGKIENVAEGDVYVVGGGVRATHVEFGARVLEGYSYDGSDSREDCSGGVSTGAASIAIGGHNGIARRANVIPVKVGCGQSVSSSALSRGLQWVQQHISSNPGHRAVILLSFPLSGSVPSELNTLAENQLVVLPAGDSSSNHCSFISPTDEIGIMVVASSTKTDTQSSSSNYGRCIDIWAPGEKVSVATSSDDTSITKETGTPYAAGAVAGAAIQNLLMIREAGEVARLKAVLLSRSTKEALTLSPSANRAATPNRLLFDICPFYKRPDHGKCYVAQTKQLVNSDNNEKMKKAAKSVVTWDDMAYNYYEDCLSVLVFASSETNNSVTATHEREGEMIMDTVFTIKTASTVITLESGPKVTVDAIEMNLGSVIEGADYIISLADHQVRTQQDDRRFVPVVTVKLSENITVSFDGHQQIRINLDDMELFREKTKGICGFLDNSHVREFVDRYENDMEFTFKENKRKYIQEWKEGDFTCEGEEVDELCRDESECQETAEQVCYPLKDPSGDFNQCFEVLDSSSWYTNCVDAVKECCCNNVDTGKCSCEEQEKYWFAALLEGCEADLPCDDPCIKPDTDKECVDDAGKELSFFYKESISYDPKDNCHYVDEHDSIECKHDGSWNKDPSDCKVKTCSTPGLTDFVEFLLDSEASYNCGDKVGYECTKTECNCNCYEMTGGSDIQCVSNGDKTAGWSSSPPSCKLTECADPRVPNVDKQINASPLSWVDFDDKSCCSGRASYHCHECYELAGTPEVGCCNNKWGDGTLPECRLKQCADPAVEVEASGDAHLSIRSGGAHYCSYQINYYCDSPCYEIEGNATRTCQPDGSWSGELPTCVKRKCPAVTSYEDGNYLFNGAEVSQGEILECGDTLHVQCNSCSFPCTSTCERTCKWNGTATVWSNSEPQCAPIMCRQRNVPNALITNKKGALQCGEASTATCNTCYRQEGGDNTRSCTQVASNQTCPLSHVDGVYDGVEITCVKMECPELVLRDNIRVVEETCSNDFKCNCVVTLECDDGCYEMNGEATLSCDGSGEWDHEIPTCSRKTCPWRQPEFSRRYNYDVEWPGKEIGIMVKRKYNYDVEWPGKEIGIMVKRKYNYDVEWPGKEIGIMVKRKYNYDVEWPGKEIGIMVKRKYNYDVEWPGGCQFESSVDGKRVSGDDTFYCGDIMDVEAVSKDCYHVCDKDRLMCQSDGTWNISSSHIPSCIYMTCDAPEPVSNAYLVNDDHEYNCTTTLRWECDKCYRHVSGDLERSCVPKDIKKDPKGQWSGLPPVCQIMACADDEIPVVTNATVTKEALSCGGKLKYTCNECTELVGNEEVICTQPDLEFSLTSWVNTPPSCQPICCPALLPVPSEDEDYQVISTGVRYTHGANPAGCGDNYVCQEVAAECDECYEYRTEGDVSDSAPTRKCVKKGNSKEGYWTNTDRMCTRKDCNVPEIPAENNLHYTVVHSTKKCNQTIDVECDCCHKISADVITDTLQCLPTKFWDKDLPKCVPITCSEPVTIDNGSFKTVEPESACTCGTVRYECDPCYRLVGSETLTCNQNTNTGTAGWSSNPPVCEPICCEHLEEPVDPITEEKSTQLVYRKGTRTVLQELGEMTVKENFATCDRDYVCQEIDPICGPCFEYNDEDGAVVDGIKNPPVKQCVKKQSDIGEIGEWTNRDKSCTLKTCPYRDIDETMHLQYTSPQEYSLDNPAHCQSTVEVTCDECYELPDGSRSQIHTCQTNKTWSHHLPTCHRSRCATPPAVPHCTYKAGENKCNFKKELECDECYYEESCAEETMSTDGIMEAQCNYDKSWSWTTKEPKMNLRQCEEAPEIEHGQVDTTGRGCGDMARYRCDRCYTFSHDSECLCERRKCVPDPGDCTRGMWNETAPTCERITCQAPPSPPTHGSLVSIDGTCDGAAVYKCDEGYYLTDGDLVRNCTEWGKWTGKHPVCSIKVCTSINSSPYRSHFPDLTHEYGTVVTFKCDDCYKFNSAFKNESVKETESIYPRFHVLKCEATGNWNGSFPVCQEKRCSNPGTPANGRMTSSQNFQCEASVTYECNTGYHFTTTSSRTVTRKCDGEKWSGTEPECVAIDCGDISVSLPLVAEYIDTLYGYEVEYTCGVNPRQRRCFHVPQPEEALCQSDGTWEYPHSGCARKQCPAPPLVPHANMKKAKINLEDTDCNQQYWYTCEEGYKMEGTPWIRCDKTAWFPQPPKCVKMSCRPQDDPTNGAVFPSLQEQGKGVLYGANITYQCNTCSELQGGDAQIRQCVFDGNKGVTWSSPEPTCNPILCYLPAISNGRITSGHDVEDIPKCGETVSFECDLGYKLVGDKQLKCTSSSKYDTVIPTCEEVTCPHPEVAQHMKTTTYPDPAATDGKYRPYTEIEYECEDGWELVGSMIISCQQDGTWREDVPRCEHSECEPLANVTHGRIVKESDILRRIECDPCYGPTNPGAEILQCIDGRWSPPKPTECEVKQCSKPDHAVGNGRLTANTIRVKYECGSSVTFKCDESYALTGQAVLRCGEDEEWDNKFPLCVEQVCPVLEEVANADTKYTYGGQQVHYVCDEGYELYGDPVRRCLNGSQWSGPGPTSCKVKHCGNVGDILYGSVTQISGGLEGGADTPGAAVQYKCKDDRYHLMGEDIRTCTNNKQWTYAPPECKCVSCPVLSLLNGIIETADENVVGTSVQYMCNPGYKMVPEGRNTRTCLESGEWDGISPKCERVRCKRRVPEGSRITGTDKAEYDYLETVQFVCEPYKNKLVYKCGDDGLWEGDVDKTCASCKERRKEVVTYVTKVIPGNCILGRCTEETTVKFPVTTYETEVVCD
ncbi:sushi, von Willebrand factor type A, EGF and pentraxin domain-containing protein 1-like isoform X1 [Bolinopsis microptera]|uniref:sushi, von Willebrand factor type A, EGF and pentraxin domain-containing protein 1-like isoform X1 n=1 Tax=Bolinopsis microptera TaxID=2820187 RepID=UPI003079DCE7